MAKYMVRRRWQIQKLIIFIQLILLPIAAGLSCNRRNWRTLTASQTCNISIDIFGMLVLIVLFFNCTKDKSDLTFRTGCFTYLISINGWGFFLDAMCWRCDGIEESYIANFAVHTGYYLAGLTAMMLFWHYLVEVAESDNPQLKKLTRILNLGAMVTFLSILGNISGNYFFDINEQGIYDRRPGYVCCLIFFCLMLLSFVVLITRMRITKGKKAALFSVVAVPLAAGVLQTFVYGTSFMFGGLMLALLIIYGKVFSEQSQELSEQKYQVLQREKEILLAKHEHQRIEMELELAANIQNHIIPQKFPAFPAYKEFSLYGEVHPARMVGGDFYDFFFVDPDHLVLMIGDVSGKGIPAALYMMAVNTMLKNAAMQKLSPGEILNFVNEQLCENADEVKMFVTVWVGIVEISTGRVIAANAGHEYPVVRNKDGIFELMKDKHGLVLGGMEGIHYREYEFNLEPGSTLVVYTDGVTEAVNDDEELFGTGRMLEALNLNPSAEPEVLLPNLKSEIDCYVGQAEQFDDITMLAFQRRNML